MDPNAGAIVPFSCLRPGESGCVVEVCGCPQWVRRLADCGLRAGSAVKMVCPGASAVCQVGDSRFSLRVDNHCEIMVQLPS